MNTVGEMLCNERVKRKLDLSDVSRELKIDSRFLQAIEDEEYEKLPGGVFAKAFVRQYGRMLGLNDEELAAQLQRQLEPPPPPEFPQKGKPLRPDTVAIQVPRMEEWQAVGDRKFKWSGSLSAAILVVVVMLVCSGVYAWLQRPRSVTTAQGAAASATAPPATAPPEPATAVPSTPTPSGQPQTAPVASASTPAAPPESAQTQPNQPDPTQGAAQPNPAAAAANTPPHNPDATVYLEITADEAVWISARADGKFAFTTTLAAGQSRVIEGVTDVVLRLGNAGGINVKLNGKPLGPVGPKGQARTVQFTSGGFHIVPAKPPAVDPLDRF
jgi:cytoskeleton protein RodZ